MSRSATGDTSSAALGTEASPEEHSEQTVLLVGNLNVGKTTLFNRLCGKKLKVANYPGTSVSIGRGTLSESGVKFHVIDTPGIDSITPDSEDEIISQEILLQEKPDLIALVADGKNLRKSLLLATQLAEFGRPLVLNINMVDEVLQRGIRLDEKKLSSLTGIPVTSTVALEGKGVGSFRRALSGARVPTSLASYPTKIESAISSIALLLKDSDLPLRAAAIALLTGDKEVKRNVATKLAKDVLLQIETITADLKSTFNRPLTALILEARLRTVDRILSQVQTITPPASMPFADKIGIWSRRPLTGIPIALLIVCLMYLFVGEFGAQILVGVVEGELFGKIITPLIERLLSWCPNQLVTDAFVGKFGLVTMGLTLALGVVVPVLATFFLAFGVLEDSGYLPRLSILLDRLLRKIGLNGKGILPLVLGFSCITMAILTTRVLETKRERFIATLLLILGLPCAPLLAVMLVLLTNLSIWASVTVFGVIITQIIFIGWIMDQILPGEKSAFILEVPPIRIPHFRSLINKTIWRVWWFIKEAVPLFMLATFILFVLEKVGTLAFLERAGKPVMTGFLGLPAESIEVVIMTLVRRESGAALLKQYSDTGQFDSVAVVVCLLVLTFLSPCVNAILVMFKERGAIGTISILAFVTTYALAVGATVNLICRTCGVSFE